MMSNEVREKHTVYSVVAAPYEVLPGSAKDPLRPLGIALKAVLPTG